jgi:hypothetical protein
MGHHVDHQQVQQTAGSSLPDLPIQVAIGGLPQAPPPPVLPLPAGGIVLDLGQVTVRPVSQAARDILQEKGLVSEVQNSVLSTRHNPHNNFLPF